MDKHVSRDVETGIQTIHSAEDGKIHVETFQDVTAYLKEAQRLRSEKSGFSDTNGLYLDARIPVVEVERWRSVLGFDWFHSSEDEKRKFKQTEHFRKWQVRRGK